MTTTTSPPPDLAPAPPWRSAGAVLALLASGAQVLSAFHHWDDAGRVALDLSLAVSDASLASFGTVLLVLAAVPALAGLVTSSGWPRFASAVLTALLVLWWVALGPVGPVAAGVWLAAGAVCGHLLAAALARA